MKHRILVRVGGMIALLGWGCAEGAGRPGEDVFVEGWDDDGGGGWEDGPGPDVEPDGADGEDEAGCVPTGPELCDGVDNDCDRLTDEDVDCECIRDQECDDHIDCTVDTCELRVGRCNHASTPALCSDGDPCNGVEICDIVLGCQPGTPINCEDGIVCTEDICNPRDGSCSSRRDHSRCTAPEMCDPPRSPNPANGCAPPPACAIDDNCSDGDLCNGVETCGADLRCHAGTRVDCDDHLACTTDRCEPADGSCLNIPPDADADTYGDSACGGTDCDDRNRDVNPGMEDTCNGVDDDCDTTTDVGSICGPLPNAASVSCIGGLCVPTCLSGWGNCDGLLANGCENSLDSLTNCGSCGTPCDLANASESCSTRTCTLLNCYAGWVNVDGVASNGCECQIESPEAGDTCATALALGNFTDTPVGDRTITGRITSAADVDCYTFTAVDDADTTDDEFHVDIRFTANPGDQFDFNVYRPDCSTQDCPSTIDSYDWYTDWTNGLSGASKIGESPCRAANTYDFNLCNDSGTAYTFCVRRRGAFPLSCDSYSIRITNGFF